MLRGSDCSRWRKIGSPTGRLVLRFMDLIPPKLADIQHEGHLLRVHHKLHLCISNLENLCELSISDHWPAV